MTFKEKVAQAVVELEPRLEDLAEGHAELMEVDEEKADCDAEADWGPSALMR